MNTSYDNMYNITNKLPNNITNEHQISTKYNNTLYGVFTCEDDLSKIKILLTLIASLLSILFIFIAIYQIDECLTKKCYIKKNKVSQQNNNTNSVSHKNIHHCNIQYPSLPLPTTAIYI